ncbi:methyltransferase [Brachybacterium sp. ACRRE]
MRRSARFYSRPALLIYDLVVVGISNSLAWMCPSRRMLAQYRDLLGARHLDVGPGTAWFLKHTRSGSRVDITLMDLNPNSLETASARIASLHPKTITADVLEELPGSVAVYDSIGVNYLFHCLPGTWDDKGAALDHLAPHLDDDGVLFGSTILGSGVEHNALGRRLMRFYNRVGIFHNSDDDVAGLQRALEARFREVRVDVVGRVAMFSARGATA